MQSLQNTLSHRFPIGLKQDLKPHRNPIGRSVTIDLLLNEYADLIKPDYTHWFGARFSVMPEELVRRAAAEARQEGRTPQHLFIHKIKQYSKSYM